MTIMLIIAATLTGACIPMLVDVLKMVRAERRLKAMESTSVLVRKAIVGVTHDQGEPALKPSDLSYEAIIDRAVTELRSDEDWQFTLANTQRWIDGTDQILNGLTWQAEVIEPAIDEALVERRARESQARLERRNGLKAADPWRTSKDRKVVYRDDKVLYHRQNMR